MRRPRRNFARMISPSGRRSARLCARKAAHFHSQKARRALWNAWRGGQAAGAAAFVCGESLHYNLHIL
jgi:hypothetical protein